MFALFLCLCSSSVVVVWLWVLAVCGLASVWLGGATSCLVGVACVVFGFVIGFVFMLRILDRGDALFQASNYVSFDLNASSHLCLETPTATTNMSFKTSEKVGSQ